MDINLMVMNAGNSRLAIGTFAAGELQYVTRVSNRQRDDWPATIAQAWSRLSAKESAAVVAASVNPEANVALESIVLELTGQSIQWVGRQIDLPIDVRTENPAQTGVDRVLNLAAAYEQMGKACVVVDAGTAVTIDCCNDEGEFLGGAIAPGANAMLEALHEKTAKLPRVTLAVPAAGFGASTEEAIRQGVYFGIRGMVRELVENYATELGSWPDVIATGGDAEILFNGWELIHAVAPDLTLYGIALAYTDHHIKHDT